MERTVPLILQWDETFDIGADTGTPVDDQDYREAHERQPVLDQILATLVR